MSGHTAQGEQQGDETNLLFFQVHHGHTNGAPAPEAAQPIWLRLLHPAQHQPSQQHHVTAGHHTTRRHRHVFVASTSAALITPIFASTPSPCLHSSPAESALFQTAKRSSSRPAIKAPSAGRLHTLCTAIRRAVVDTPSQHPPCTSPEALCPSVPSIDPLEAGKMDAVLAAVQQAKSPKERLDAAEAWRVRAALVTVGAASGAHSLCFRAERFLARSTPAPTGGFPGRRAEYPPGSCGVRRGGGAAARRQRKGGWLPRGASRSAHLAAFPAVRPPATRPGLTCCVCAGGGRGGGCPARARGCRPGGPGKTSRSFAPAAAAPGGDAGRRPGDCA